MSVPSIPPRIAGLEYVRPLGKGGFAHVHLYDQDMPRRQVAVKALQEGLETTRDRSSFAAEADAMARLSSHPSIVSIFQVGVSTDGQLYIAMEYCPDSMRERTRGNPAHLRTVLDAGVRLAGALESTHRAGVLHRDIKPSNVLITATGRPALTDFGIASLYGRNANSKSEQALSLPWAAPEVIEGFTTGTVASEIWSLGASLYTFAAGRSPFESENSPENTHAKMRARIVEAQYVPVPGASGYEPFDALMAHAMNPRAEDRFPSMQHFGEALQRAQRYFDFEVTRLEMTPLEARARDSGGTARIAGFAADANSASGQVRPANRSVVREKVRAGSEAQAADRDGVVPDRPTSPIRAGLVGAAIGVGGVLLAVLLARSLGWI